MINAGANVVWLLGATSVGLGAALTPAQASYVQVSCEVTPDYAIIWVDEVANAASRASLRFNVQFDPTGVVVRLPPQFYSPSWSQIQKVEMAYGSETSNSGELHLRIRDSAGLERTETIGTVRRSCWDRVRNYIRRQIEAKGISVHLSEAIAK